MDVIKELKWKSAADVVPDEVTRLLRASAVIGPTEQVVGVDAEPVGVGVGLLSLLWRLRVAYEPAGAGPETMVLKLPHTSPETLATVAAFRFYEREIRFYSEFAERSPLGTPRCYASSFDADTGNFVLLLEDLSSWLVHDQLAGCPVDAARRALVALAAHHATWWDDPAIVDAGWTVRPCDPPNPQGIVARFGASWPVIETHCAEVLPGPVFDVAKRMDEIALPLLETGSEEPVTLLHGDFRLDNLFFAAEASPDKPDVAVVDWQICMIGRGPADVGLFLSQSMDADLRKESERELLGAYHETLVANGVEGYDFDHCWDDYRSATLLCLVYPLVAGGGLDLVNDRALEWFKMTLDRSARAIMDLDALELVP